MHFRFLLTFFIISMLPSCLTQADQQQQADQIVLQLHKAIQHKQWDDAIKLFNPDFFKTEPKEHWKKQLLSLQATLGEINDFHIVSKSKDPRFGGDFYIYIISIKHQHGFSHETITIFKSLDDEQALTIAGYQIKAQRNQ